MKRCASHVTVFRDAPRLSGLRPDSGNVGAETVGAATLCQLPRYPALHRPCSQLRDAASCSRCLSLSCRRTTFISSSHTPVSQSTTRLARAQRINHQQCFSAAAAAAAAASANTTRARSSGVLFYFTRLHRTGPYYVLPACTESNQTLPPSPCH